MAKRERNSERKQKKRAENIDAQNSFCENFSCDDKRRRNDLNWSELTSMPRRSQMIPSEITEVLISCFRALRDFKARAFSARVNVLRTQNYIQKNTTIFCL